MKITCFGSRGSLPAPATKEFDTREYGGNTSCYYVEAGPHRIILDCGSGIRTLGNQLLKSGEGFKGTWIVLLSHYHWDHIQGLPFCIPMFFGGNRFIFHGFKPAGHKKGLRPIVEEMLDHQQSNPHFPVAHIDMPSTSEYHDHARQFSEEFWYFNDEFRLDQPARPAEDCLHIRTIPLNHPDGCLGYRIEYEGKVMVYATDNEPLRHNNAMLTRYGADADWMLLDGQYKEETLAGQTQTYGHGTPEACVEQARACNVKKLVIHHHDPGHDDETLRVMEDAVKEDWIEFAREGQVWNL